MARIVVIESDPDISWLLERLLARAGHEVRTAERFVDGAALAADWLPQAILIDLASPAQTMERLRVLKANSATAPIPLVALSARCDINATDARAAGYDGFVTKPFFSIELLAQLAHSLNPGPRARLECGGRLSGS